jgi:excisionase family DNA binding protein
MEQLLNNKEAAEFLKVSPHSLRRYVALKQIPFTKIGKRLVRFRLSDLETYVKRQTIPARRREGE